MVGRQSGRGGNSGLGCARFLKKSKMTAGTNSGCLTFELSGRRRQDARARAEKMYRVPQAGPWWPAVGAPLERGVRRHCVL